jgi:two-component system chemotaxis response regulator CheY
MRTALIVDDAAVMRMRLRDILEPRYQVIAEAENGEQALDLYKSEAPDFIVKPFEPARVLVAVDRLFQI